MVFTQASSTGPPSSKPLVTDTHDGQDNSTQKPSLCGLGHKRSIKNNATIYSIMTFVHYMSSMLIN